MSGIDPIDVVELKNWLANLGEMSWTFFEELTNRGFSRSEALTLTSTWRRR